MVIKRIRLVDKFKLINIKPRNKIKKRAIRKE